MAAWWAPKKAVEKDKIMVEAKVIALVDQMDFEVVVLLETEQAGWMVVDLAARMVD